ncbi:hypothetical protein E4U31_007033 [Claviceps sp. LM219 group G6]|nr:hypothetical protein E4U31_007033 [Claviceps sp. LM219 group G6]
MSHEIPQQSDEGSMDGRPWSSAELFAFIGFLSDEKNDGALQNTTMKFASPTLKKASEVMTERFPKRRWPFDTTIRQQFTRLRDDWRMFKDILDASGTEWNDEARSFELSEAQRAAFVHKYGGRANRIIDNGLPINERLDINIDTHANIFADEPDAGRNIFESDDIYSLDVSARARDDPFSTIEDTRNNSNAPHSIATNPTQTASPKPSRVTKTTRKKAPSRATPKGTGTVVNTLANNRLRHPDLQEAMIAFADVEKCGLSREVNVAILQWLRKDPKNNPALWNSYGDVPTKLALLATEPGFEGVEFPVL